MDQKKFKESMEGVLLDKFKDEHQREFNLIKDENLSLEDKQKLAQNLVERYLRENGYQGVIPEVLLTDEAHSFTVDSKDKATGTKRREKIYFSINDIADPNLAFSRLFGHEKAHMNTYDEGKYGEETSIHTREKIGSENKNKVFTEEEKTDYLNNLRNKYKNQKSIEKQFAEAKLVPEKDKEHYVDWKNFNKYLEAEKFVKDNTYLLSKMYKVAKEKILNNPKKYTYYYIQDTNNVVFKDKEDFEKEQAKLRAKIASEKDDKKRRELEKELYYKLPDSMAQLHNIEIDENGEVYINIKFPNEKYVNKKGKEVVINKKTGEIINDGINNGTYNMGVWEGSYNFLDFDVAYENIIHLGIDVPAWIDYGVNSKDKLTKAQREELYEISKLYFKDYLFREVVDKNEKLNYKIYQEYMNKWR